jgi:hypothetical protein
MPRKTATHNAEQEPVCKPVRRGNADFFPRRTPDDFFDAYAPKKEIS